ncbi:MAG: hypothetical protein KBD63_05120 [Bacteriovoracaceae bacterium]|nr:hypothetical protein [Bacteriovoracaceae bacterium]
MLNETLGTVSSQAIEEGDLQHYFDEKSSEVAFSQIEKILENNTVSFYRGDYKRESHCFRFILNQEVFDFPSNWSVFKTLGKNYKNNKMWVTILKENDHDYLLSIFSLKEPSLKAILFFLSKGFLHLAFIKEANTTVLKEINQELGQHKMVLPFPKAS